MKIDFFVEEKRGERKREKEKYMNFDLIESVEEKIKIKQQYEIIDYLKEKNDILCGDSDTPFVLKFNGWYIKIYEYIDLEYIELLNIIKDFDSIKLLFGLYKEKLLFNNLHEDDCRIFKDINILKMFIDSCKDELIKLDEEMNILLYYCCQNYECIKLLVDTYGDKLQVKSS